MLKPAPKTTLTFKEQCLVLAFFILLLAGIAGAGHAIGLIHSDSRESECQQEWDQRDNGASAGFLDSNETQWVATCVQYTAAP